jgi:molecular chaperone GrpE
MTEEEKNQGPVKVHDRRRFDPEGNPRVDVDNGGTSTASTPPGEPQANRRAAETSEEVQRLRAELEAAHKRIDELARAFQALERDREDFKARLTRERERVLEVEKGNVALLLLEVMDELELSLQASGDDQSPLAKGVRLIRDGILKKIQALGIERVDVIDRAFDPNVAEAADTEVTTEPTEDQKVVAVVRPGYRLKDRIIRPARVKVARYSSPAQA